MARAATTTDAFNAVAEPCRRDILTLLRSGERSSGEVASALGLRQPAASKHLGVLHQVGLVRCRKEGRHRLYTLSAGGLEPIHRWTGGFAEFWNGTFDRLDAYVSKIDEATQ